MVNMKFIMLYFSNNFLFILHNVKCLRVNGSLKFLPRVGSKLKISTWPSKSGSEHKPDNGYYRPMIWQCVAGMLDIPK